MKSLTLTITLLAIVCLPFILTGCGGTPNTPEGVVQKQINAFKKWDVAALTTCVDADEARLQKVAEQIKNAPENTKKDMMTLASYAKIIKSEINGDKATVDMTIPAWGKGGVNVKEQQTAKVHLVNKNGKWLLTEPGIF